MAERSPRRGVSLAPAPTPQTPVARPGLLNRTASLDAMLSGTAGLPLSPESPPGSLPQHSKAWTSSVRKLQVVKHVIQHWELVQISPAIGDIPMTRLMKACAKDQLEVVQAVLSDLLQQDNISVLAAELQAKDSWAGSSPLHWAAFSGNPAIARALLDAGANPLATNDRDQSLPIHLAARYDRSEVIEALAEHAPSSLLVKRKGGFTPLHEAAAEGKVGALTKLLRMADKAGISSARSSLDGGVTRAAMLAARTDDDLGGYTPLLSAVEYGRTDIISVLLEHGADPSIEAVVGGAVAALERSSQVVQAGVAPIASRRFLFRHLSMSTVGGVAAPSAAAVAAAPSAGPSLTADSEVEAGRSRFRIPGHGALSLALSAGHLDVVEQLLMSAAMGPESRFPPVFSLAQLKRILVEVWANTQLHTSSSQPGADRLRTAHLLTVLVLCAKPHTVERRLMTPHADSAPSEAAATDAPSSTETRSLDERLRGHDDDDDDVESGGSPPPVEVASDRVSKPQNPVLVALKLAAECERAQRAVRRDRLRVTKLKDGAMLLEFIACGLLHAADRAVSESETTKGFNPWRMGTKKILPQTARDLFVHESIDFAARHDLKIFISHPIVYAHLQEVFWPTLLRRRPMGQGHLGGSGYSPAFYAGTAFLNLVSLPLLPFVPNGWEVDLEEYCRNGQPTHASSTAPAAPPLILFWLLPVGRFALWFGSTLGLAQLATSIPPLSPELGPYDLALLAYLIGWVKAEAGELRRATLRGEGLRGYATNAFNVLDVLICILLALLLVGRRAQAFDPQGALNPTGPIAPLVLPCQALLALIASIRLMQVLFIFATSGPLLIMSIRMLEDLWQFLTLAGFVVLAFACSFYVLFSHQIATQAIKSTHIIRRYGDDAALGAAGVNGGGGADVDSLSMAGGPPGELSLASVLGLLVTASMKGEPDQILAGHLMQPFAWAVMFLFGLIVVLLLLNLLIARFAKTFDMVYENVDANFKVAFARVVIECREKDLLPPPLNILRMLINSTRLGIVQLAQRGVHACLPSSWWSWKTLDNDDDDDDDDDPSSRRKARNGGGGGDEGASGSGGPKETAYVAQQVREYLRRALDVGEPLPTQVAAYVVQHQHDIGREDQWRTEFAKQIGHVTTQLGGVEAGIRADLASEMQTLRAEIKAEVRALESARRDQADGTASEAARRAEASVRATAKAEAAGSLARAEALASRDGRYDKFMERLEVALPALLDHAAHSETLSARLDGRLRQLEQSVERQLEGQQRAILERLSTSPASGKGGGGEASSKDTYLY